MKRTTIDIASLQAIDPESISLYLSGQQWHQIKTFEDSSLWSLELQDGQIARILLPLDKSLPDFDSRIYDLIRALSQVEDRPPSDVLNSIKNALQIAKESSKEVLNLHLSKADKDLDGIPAKYLGSLLGNFQALMNAIAQFEDGKANNIGPISREILKLSEFSVIRTFKGSFGISLAHEILDVEQLDLLQDPLARRSMESLIQLLKSSKKESELRENLIRFKKRVASGYRKFLMALTQAEIDSVFEWGSPEGDRLERVKLSYAEALQAMAIASKTVVEEPTEIEIETAEWIGGNSRREDFELKDVATDETYVGKVAASALADAKQARWYELYKAVLLEEIEVNESTQEAQSKFILLSLMPLTNHRDNSSEKL